MAASTAQTFSPGQKVEVVSAALGKPGTVATVKKALRYNGVLSGYNIRLPNGTVEFALASEIKPTGGV